MPAAAVGEYDTGAGEVRDAAANLRSQGRDGRASMLKWKPANPMIDFDRDTAFTQKMLDVLGARTKAALHNVANQHVAGFKRYEVRFEDLLRDAESSGGGIDSVEPVTQRDESGPAGLNNVVLMEELAILGKTSLLHDVMTRRAGSYFATLNKAIVGR